jgi:glycosyltransferase involved in cell wall biosynthesis
MTQHARADGLSLVISTLDEGTELYETMLSVFAGSVIPDEAIVVDDGGTDDSCAVLQQPEWCARGVVVHRIRRSGVAAARNAGSALATKPYLAFLDAHCRLDPACLAQLSSSLKIRPDSVLAPAIRDVDGDDDYGCGARLIDAALRIRWLRPSARDSLYPLPVVPGGCFALSRATFDRLRGFGNFRELGLEDVDFSLRAWRMGIDILAVPAARLTHRFRPYPPYRLSSASRAYNAVRVALIHFEGDRREECLRTIIGTPRAAEVLVDAFASDWEDQRDHLAANAARAMGAYFDTFGDWR